MKSTNSVFSSYGVTVFTTMSQLATETGSINLGQGFPDQDGPEDLRQIAAAAILEGPNQYPPMMGIPELRQAVADHNNRFYDLDVDWQTEVMVTSGATEALNDCLIAMIEPGDEVVLIEPLFDCYLPIIQRAGGIPVMVRIEPPLWELPREALAAAFSEKTKLILLNSPHNPAGKVFSLDDLQYIADLVLKHDIYAICDEVYEHLVYEGHTHTPLMALPGMRDRCAKVGSAGKTFSMTGWKLGYVTAAPGLMSTISKAHQFVTFTTPPHLQKAISVGLMKDDSYFNGLSRDLQEKRDRLSRGLADIGFEVMETDGTYFLNVDIRSVGFNGTDEEFCRHITLEAGVTAIPISAFYLEEATDHFVRFCFCKSDATLDEAILRLKKHFND